MDADNDNDGSSESLGSIALKCFDSTARSCLYGLQNIADHDFYKNFGMGYEIEIDLKQNEQQLEITDRQTATSVSASIPETISIFNELVYMHMLVRSVSGHDHSHPMMEKYHRLRETGISKLALEINDIIILGRDSTEMLFHTLFQMHVRTVNLPKYGLRVISNNPECP